MVGRTQANVNLLKVILKQYGVDPNKVEIVQFPANEAADAIRNQKADAYLAAGPVNSKITADAIAASTRDGGTPTFLAIDSAEAIAQNHPVYEASEIPAGTFGGSPAKPEEEVKTISFSHHIVARKGLSESTVATFTRQLFAIRQTLKTDFPLAAKIETPDTDKDAVLPAHPGAAAYVDGEEKTFLDRYSDFIWWGLMALSAMGSAGAWFAGYLKKDERSNNSSLRERLLDMIAAARRSDSTEELDRMQAEADDILRDTLRLLRARRHRGRVVDRLQYRARTIPQRGGRPQGGADEHAAKPAAGGRAVPGDRHLVNRRFRAPADGTAASPRGGNTGRNPAKWRDCSNFSQTNHLPEGELSAPSHCFLTFSEYIASQRVRYARSFWPGFLLGAMRAFRIPGF